MSLGLFPLSALVALITIFLRLHLRLRAHGFSFNNSTLTVHLVWPFYIVLKSPMTNAYERGYFILIYIWINIWNALLKKCPNASGVAGINGHVRSAPARALVSAKFERGNSETRYIILSQVSLSLWSYGNCCRGYHHWSFWSYGVHEGVSCMPASN